MKVLKNNYETHTTTSNTEIEHYPRKHICELCGSELEYDESDLRIGVYGLVLLGCPCCGHDNTLEDHEDTLILTKDNIKFPTHFYHTSKENGAVDCCTNEEIKKAINKAIDYFRKNKDEFAWMTATGNLHVTVFRLDGDEDYAIVVTKDYYTTYIPFEEKDY